VFGGIIGGGIVAVGVVMGAVLIVGFGGIVLTGAPGPDVGGIVLMGAPTPDSGEGGILIGGATVVSLAGTGPAGGFSSISRTEREQRT
jgi:hypothetical protein